MARETDLIVCGSERQQSDAARALDRRRQQPLMSRAIAGDPARRHLAALADEGRYRPQILIIDPQAFIGAKTTNLAPEHRPATLAALVFIGPLAARSRAPFVLCHKLRYLLFRLDLPSRPGFSDWKSNQF